VSLLPWVGRDEKTGSNTLGDQRLYYERAAMPLLNRCVGAQHDDVSLTTVVCSLPSMHSIEASTSG